jgi:hypothetical protein
LSLDSSIWHLDDRRLTEPRTTSVIRLSPDQPSGFRVPAAGLDKVVCVVYRSYRILYSAWAPGANPPGFVVKGPPPAGRFRLRYPPVTV